MTTRELFEVFNREYRDGWPIVEGQREGPPPNERKLFEKHCRYNCVTDAETIEQEWQKHVAGRKVNRGKPQRRTA